MPWSAITFVSSGVTLAAFVVASVAWVLRLTVLQRERMIRAAPEAARAKLVAAALETFHVDPERLTKLQQHDLAVRQITERARRGRLVAAVLVAVILVTAGTALATELFHAPDARLQLLADLSADLNIYLDRVRNLCEDIEHKRLTPDELKQLAPSYNQARQTLMRTDELHRREIRDQWTHAAVAAYDKVILRVLGPSGIDALIYEMNTSCVDRVRQAKSPDYEALSAHNQQLIEQISALETDLHALYAVMGAEDHLDKTFGVIAQIKKTGQ